MKYFFFIIVIFFTLVSCKSNNIQLLNADDITSMSDEEIYFATHKSISTFLDQGKFVKLKSLKVLIVRSDTCFRVDSLVLFNREMTKCYTTINIKDEWPRSSSDKLKELYGVKIKNSWYFYLGSILVLPRSCYQYDVNGHLSFEELSYLAHEKRHIKFLIDKGGGKYEVDNERLEEYITPLNLLGTLPENGETENETWLKAYDRKLNDTLSAEEILRIYKAKAKAEAEFVPKQFPKPKKTPIFETKAWKNRHKEK